MLMTSFFCREEEEIMDEKSSFVVGKHQDRDKASPADVKWIRKWERLRSPSQSPEPGEIANMAVFDYSVLLSEIEHR